MKGFSLLHSLVSMIVFASITVAGLQWQRFTTSVDKGRNLGQQYLTLNSAVNNYMVTYYQSLIALKPACSEMTFTTTNPASPPSTNRSSTDCKLTIATGKTVANGLQPSPAELITLGLLPASATIVATNLLQIESPNLPTNSSVFEYMSTVPTTHSGASQSRLFINIEMICLQRGNASNPNTGTAVPTTPGTTGCPSATTTTALKSLIFNTQPYNNDLKSYAFTFPALLGSVFTTLGDDAVTSGMTDVKLVNSGSTLNGKNFQIANPITGGPSGIMGVRGGYGASYTMQHSRVDGSNPPTADWSFGGHGVSDISKLKLPVKVLGNPCDLKEDIALDAQANLLICRNSIWSSFSTANSGTLDISEYISLYVQFLPEGASNLTSITQRHYINYDQVISFESLPESAAILGMADTTRSDFMCGNVTTKIKIKDWYPEITRTDPHDVYFYFYKEEGGANSDVYQISLCGPSPNVILGKILKFNKINK
jgi:hypothetical protein